jgi:hypothetical protein
LVGDAAYIENVPLNPSLRAKRAGFKRAAFHARVSAMDVNPIPADRMSVVITGKESFSTESVTTESGSVMVPPGLKWYCGYPVEQRHAVITARTISRI